ncbi:hypothetical protein RCL1_007581 [Eukaryota sp. TZLM3-RCL]
MRRYKVLKPIGEGTFGHVLKAINVDNGEVTAIKHMKAKFSSWADCVNLKEVRSLRKLSHTNIIKLKEVIHQNDELFLVFEYMDCNLYEHIKNRTVPLSESKCKLVTYQLLKALAYIHSCGTFHRDVKPENILVAADLSTPVKLADFGSCRDSNHNPPYTEYISTRWYRAPECLLTDGYYSSKMDLFAVGCILFEMLTSRPLFPGKDEFDQVNRIHGVLGTPTSAILNRFKKKGSHIQNWTFTPQRGCGLEPLLPSVSPECLNLLYQLLAYLPEDRISAKQAIKHDWFMDLRRKERDKRAQKESSIGTINVPATTPTPSKPSKDQYSPTKSEPVVGNSKTSHSSMLEDNGVLDSLPLLNNKGPSVAGNKVGAGNNSGLNFSTQSSIPMQGNFKLPVLAGKANVSNATSGVRFPVDVNLNNSNKSLPKDTKNTTKLDPLFLLNNRATAVRNAYAPQKKTKNSVKSLLQHPGVSTNIPGGVPSGVLGSKRNAPLLPLHHQGASKYASKYHSLLRL